MQSTPESERDNWLRFDGDSTEPEWDIESDVDDVDFDQMSDIDEY